MQQSVMQADSMPGSCSWTSGKPTRPMQHSGSRSDHICCLVMSLAITTDDAIDCKWHHQDGKTQGSQKNDSGAINCNSCGWEHKCIPCGKVVCNRCLCRCNSFCCSWATLRASLCSLMKHKGSLQLSMSATKLLSQHWRLRGASAELLSMCAPGQHHLTGTPQPYMLSWHISNCRYRNTAWCACHCKCTFLHFETDIVYVEVNFQSVVSDGLQPSMVKSQQVEYVTCCNNVLEVSPDQRPRLRSVTRIKGIGQDEAR